MMSHRNCLLIIIDTLRADVLAPYGGDIPFFAGRTWQRAFAPSGWTLPSHAAIFTGLAPFDCGLVHHDTVLRPDCETMAEAFRAAGFFTFASLNNENLEEKFGLARGFDRSTYSLPSTCATRWWS